MLPIVMYVLYYPPTGLLLVGGVAFVIALPVLFFWPLLGARRSMQRMKQVELDLLGNHFSEAYERFKEKLAADEFSETLLQEAEILEQADNIFSTISAQPAWPFSKSLLAKFISIVGAVIAFLASAYFGG